MSELTEKINTLNDMVLDGRLLEAFDTFYHEDVVMQENENAPTIGKSANRIREEQFLSSITEFREARPLKVTAGQSWTMVEWFYDYTHKEWGERKYTQVSVQEWKDGSIIREKFYYNS